VLLENQLDGFSINPRIVICFSGPISAGSLQTAIAFSPLGALNSSIGVNQILYDSVGNCAYAKPDRVLNQQSQYLLFVTSDLTDTSGKPIAADKDFSTCVKGGGSAYCQALSNAVGQFKNKNDQKNIIAASLFTTMSATTWLEKARAQVNSPLFSLGSLLAPTVTFDLSSLASITWMPQSGLSGVNYNQTLPLNVLTGVGKIAFGLFLSPIYLNLAGPQQGTISTTPTQLPIAPPSLVIPVSFHVFLPATPAPFGGYPVIIYGHGLGDNQFGAPTYAAGSWAAKGFATLAMEITGHGYGPLGQTQVTATTGPSVFIPTPGRGVQLSPSAPIGATDGCILPTALATRDCSRQTAVDLAALVLTIKNTHGLGLNLNSSKIYYVGQSFGAFYGTLAEAVEPGLGAGTLNDGGGTQVDVARLSPIARALGAAYLGSFQPSLLNGAYAPPEAYFHDAFNDEYVYRGQVITDHIPGALAIQAAFESADWLGMLGDPLSYAAHLQAAPLAGVPAKPILVQLSLGDLEVPNPTEAALITAGGLQSSTWMLRTDLAAAIDPSILGIVQPGVPYPIYPHRFLSNPTIFNPSSPALQKALALAAQNQIADFFNSGNIPNPNAGLPFNPPLFQQPNPLPSGLNFLQIAP
jgi:hypothetical protein